MNKKLFLLPVAVAGMSLVACGGSKPGPQPDPKPEEYKASLAISEALSLSNEKAIQGEDYVADIKIKDFYTDLCELPNTLIEVKSGETVLHTDEEEYFYTIESEDEEKYGHVRIPGEFVQGDIVIKLAAIADSIEVTVVSETLTFAYTEPRVGDRINIDVAVQKERPEQVLPEQLSENSIKVNPDGTGDIDITQYCEYKTNENRTRGRITIPSTYGEEGIVKDVLTICVNGKEKLFTVNASSDTLNFTNLTNETTHLNDAKYGSSYQFKMEAKEPSTHKIPNSLKIDVGGITIGSTQYGINNEGIVTIKAGVINGNVEISGEAIENEKILVSFVGYGVKSSKSGMIKKGQPFVTEITVFEGNVLPERENIGVGIYDNTKGEFVWQIDNDKITYTVHDKSATLTIAAELTNSEIVIVSKARNLRLLNTLDWETISSFSKNGYAPYLFEYGEETKEFEIEGRKGSYKARILDFNRDPYKGTSRTLVAGITFEFTQCVLESQFSSAENPSNSTYYASQGATAYESELYQTLNSFSTGLYNKVPFKKYLVEVEKLTMIGTEGIKTGSTTMIADSYNYMFPLSLYEMNYPNLHHGYEEEHPALGGSTSKPYYYYNNVPGIEKLIKEGIYWSRTSSEYEIASNNVNCILKDGSYHFMNTSGTSRLVSPAFCI